MYTPYPGDVAKYKWNFTMGKLKSQFLSYSFVLYLLSLSIARCKSMYAVNLVVSVVWRVWRYQRGNHNPYIEEQTTQWPKEKVQKDKQRSTKHIYKTRDRVTWTPIKAGVELGCSGRVSSSYFCSIRYFKINEINTLNRYHTKKFDSCFCWLFQGD